MAGQGEAFATATASPCYWGQRPAPTGSLFLLLPKGERPTEQ